jgi:hypothetical protein
LLAAFMLVFQGMMLSNAKTLEHATLQSLDGHIGTVKELTNGWDHLARARRFAPSCSSSRSRIPT